MKTTCIKPLNKPHLNNSLGLMPCLYNKEVKNTTHRFNTSMVNKSVLRRRFRHLKGLSLLFQMRIVHTHSEREKDLYHVDVFIIIVRVHLAWMRTNTTSTDGIGIGVSMRAERNRDDCFDINTKGNIYILNRSFRFELVWAKLSQAQPLNTRNLHAVNCWPYLKQALVHKCW